MKFLKYSNFETKKLIFLSPKLISITSDSNKLFKSEIIVSVASLSCTEKAFASAIRTSALGMSATGYLHF